MFVSTFVKKLKKAFRMYANPIEIPKIRKNQFRVLRPLKLRKVVGFGNFARIASLCVGFLLGTLHGYYFHSDFWPNLNFPLEHQIKLVLISRRNMNLIERL